jgi:hypothetical protein
MNFNGEGGDDVQGVLESLMGQLMSKEVLYEPLKELHQKVESLLNDWAGIDLILSSQNIWKRIER